MAFPIFGSLLSRQIKPQQRTSYRWTYGRELQNTRYSPPDQIDITDFNDLEVAWRFKTDFLGAQPEYKFESTPLLAKGIIYTIAGSRRDVVALDGETGKSCRCTARMKVRESRPPPETSQDAVWPMD
jgi:quinoprotein glucose dehydrogenase